MRPLQCPSCGHALGAAAPGPGGRRTCPRCHFSFVPVHAGDAVPDSLLDRFPVLVLSLVLLPFAIGALMQWFAPQVLQDWLRPAFGPGIGRESLATASGESPEPGRPAAQPPAKRSTEPAKLTTRPAPHPPRYPAIVEKVVPLEPGLLPPILPLPGTVAPPPPPVPLATLELLSNPQGATVINDANGVGLGTTPLVLSLQGGAYRLRFTLPGRPAKIADVALGPGDVRRLEIQLAEEVAATPGLLVLDSEPIQADVYRDGYLIGATPLSLELPPGLEHQLLLRKGGYEDLLVSVRVPAGGRQRVRAILTSTTPQAAPAWGTTTAPDDWARILMAGGTAPALGSYRLALPVLGSAGGQNVLTGGISPESQGDISGVIRLVGQLPPLEFLPVRVDSATCGISPRASEKLQVTQNRGIANVVVWLGDRQLDKLLGPPVVNSSLQLVDCRFLPHVQAIPAGTTVQFSNLQLIPFLVQLTDQQGLTGPLHLPAGRTGVPQTFKTAGVYRVTEGTGHDWMQAYIHVMPNPFFTISDAGGQFTLRGVPKGEHLLLAWHESLGSRTSKLSVAAGSVTTLLLEYQSTQK